MYNMWNEDLGPVRIKSDWERVWFFPCLTEALVFARRQRFRIVDSLSDLALPDDDPAGRYQLRLPVVLIDACDLVIPAWRIEQDMRLIANTPPPIYNRRYRRLPRYEPERDFRYGPVPGIRNYQPRNYFRQIHTLAELRAHAALETDMADQDTFPIRIKIRARRKTIPSAWDDILHARRGDGWKNYRKTQYKKR